MRRALFALLLLALPARAGAAEPDPEDPPACRAAIEARPEATALGRPESRTLVVVASSSRAKSARLTPARPAA